MRIYNIFMKKLLNSAKKDEAIRFAYIVMSNLLSALAVDMFLSGNGIAGGGFAGIAIIINYVVYVPVGLFVFVLTIPLFVWAYFVKGWRYVLDTLVSTAMYSLMTDLLVFLPCATTDKFLAAVCGGGLYALSEVCMVLQLWFFCWLETGICGSVRVNSASTTESVAPM